jgi:hypothetical protein
MEGETSIAGLAIDMDHFYQVSGKCDVEVSQAAKLFQTPNTTISQPPSIMIIIQYLL